jgi:FkbM family methyltransferase
MSLHSQHLDRVIQSLQAQQARTERDLLKVRQSVAALRAESVLRRQGREPRLPLEFTSQFGEDLLVWSLLAGQTSGFFVEAGAFDGYRYSVTYPLEAIGWNGLLVEAIPRRHAECVIRRPHSRVVHAALGSRPGGGTTEFCVVEDQYGGMLSYSKPTPSHLRDLGNTPRSLVSVPIATLNELLQEHAGPVDLVVLDLEGAELDALAGFDIGRFLPRILLIEDNLKGQDPALRNFMKALPYHSAGYLAVNDVYIRKDQNSVIEQLRWL